MTEREQLLEIKELITESNQRLEHLEQEMQRTNDRGEIYQKSSQQVVNLAFSLILAATAAIVIPAIFGR
ncbi:conserved hypothetical protein [Rippkaea orientalis PCC 8801]|uniref:Uncharacterized protein n=1 Tax=Rippkaea orientalis (strain PCC 8801 / RF-1) TaxID=41431 RepID=B7K0S1_RIPO1|nr:hypothetical protein [Rippkaea orientalis]ACK64225.1 conserved hypothetical protein [Rippkaea orientalis PCC 8801]